MQILGEDAQEESLVKSAAFHCSKNKLVIYRRNTLFHYVYKGTPQCNDCWMRRQIMGYDSGSKIRSLVNRGVRTGNRLNALTSQWVFLCFICIFRTIERT